MKFVFHESFSRAEILMEFLLSNLLKDFMGMES